MSTGLFGPRGPSYYNPNFSSSYVRPYPHLHPAPTEISYPNGYLNPVYSYYPYTNQQTQFYPTEPYHWGATPVIVPPKGLDKVLIAILLLVVLDQILIRPLKTAH